MTTLMLDTFKDTFLRPGSCLFKQHVIMSSYSIKKVMKII